MLYPFQHHWGGGLRERDYRRLIGSRNPDVCVCSVDDPEFSESIVSRPHAMHQNTGLRNWTYQAEILQCESR